MVKDSLSDVGIVGANGIRPDIQIYPNPTRGQLTIGVEGECHSHLRVGCTKSQTKKVKYLLLYNYTTNLFINNYI
jgi:hypothetical protein